MPPVRSNPVRPAASAAFGCLLGVAPIAPAQDERLTRVLIDRDLHEREVTLVAITDKRIIYEGRNGMPGDEPLTEYVAMIPARRGPAAPAPLPALWLTDGQRLAGAPRNGESPESTIAWQHPVFGVLPVPLDDVSRVVLRKTRRGGPASPEADRDVVTLVNADRLAGFLESFGPTVRLDADGQAREVSRLRVAEAALANPSVPARGLTLWLADGSVVRAAALATSRGEVRLTPDITGYASDGFPPPTEAPSDGAATPLVLADIVAAAFDAGSIVPLASVPPASQKPVGDRRWAEPVSVGAPDTAVLGAADVTLPGPMTVEWQLPDGALRLSCELELPPDLWSWGDCEVVLALVQARQEPMELARERLNAARPRVPVNVGFETPEARLRVTLEAARYGPIQDRAILRRPIFLIDPR